MKTSLLSLFSLIEKGAVLSIKRVNGSFSIQIQSGLDLIAIEIDRSTFEEKHLIHAFTRLSEIASSKIEA